MIDSIDQQLKDWMTAHVSGTDIMLSAPLDQADQSTVCLHLYQINSAIPSRRDGPKPIELALHYLVTTQAATPLEAHRLLGDILLAALDTADFAVDMSPLPTDVWRALGIASQPAFVIVMPLVKERQSPTALVTQPVQVQLAPLANVSGTVLGPGDMPVPQARVEVRGTKNVAYTDSRGRFSLGSVSADAASKELRIVARGAEQLISAPITAGKPIVIRFQP